MFLINRYLSVGDMGSAMTLHWLHLIWSKDEERFVVELHCWLIIAFLAWDEQLNGLNLMHMTDPYTRYHPFETSDFLLSDMIQHYTQVWAFAASLL